MPDTISKTVTLLVIDDDEVDRELVSRSLKKARIANPVVTVADGEAALARLRGTDGEAPLARPYIVLLDWRMPRMDGPEFLAELRADADLEGSVVFVLTTSNAEEDIAVAYLHKVSGYVVKDNAGRDFMQLTELLEAYWRVVELPA